MKFDWRGGDIVYSDCELDENVDLEAQAHLLKEDLIQVVYPGDILIDVGWYVDYFVVAVIEKNNWGEPLIWVQCPTLRSLRFAVCAIVAQLVEHELPKLGVAGSSPAGRFLN
jgi:hypothetical protein